MLSGRPNSVLPWREGRGSLGLLAPFKGQREAFPGASLPSSCCGSPEGVRKGSSDRTFRRCFAANQEANIDMALCSSTFPFQPWNPRDHPSSVLGNM